jgi:predicted peptidase
MVLAAIIGCGSRGPVAIPDAKDLPKLGPGTHLQTTDVPGVGSLNYTIAIPEGYDGTKPVPLVLALHYGYDGARPEPYTGKGMIQAFRSGLERLGAIVVAPDVLGGDWTDARNEQAAVWLTRSALKTYNIERKKILITGFSMGGEGTWHIGSRHQDLFTGAIPVAAPVAGGEVEWTIPVYVIHSDKDDVVSYAAAKRHADALLGKGAKLQMKTIAGLGHFETPAYGAYVGEGVEWLQAAWK